MVRYLINSRMRRVRQMRLSSGARFNEMEGLCVMEMTQTVYSARFMRLITQWLLGVVAGLIVGCGSAPVKTRATADTSQKWATRIFSDNPLVGRIWSSKDKAFIGKEQLFERLKKTPLILIGERHDNPDHHRLQARILMALNPGARVGFEMLDHDDADALTKATNADSVRTLTNWDKSGWPKFEIYAPIFEAVFSQKHIPVAVHPRRVQIRQSMMGPTSQAHGNGTYDGPLSSDGQAALRKDIDQSHCGHASERPINAMMVAQEFKRSNHEPNTHGSTGRSAACPDRGERTCTKRLRCSEPRGRPRCKRGLNRGQWSGKSPSAYGAHRYDYLWFSPRLTPSTLATNIAKRLKR